MAPKRQPHSAPAYRLQHTDGMGRTWTEGRCHSKPDMVQSSLLQWFFLLTFGTPLADPRSLTTPPFHIKNNEQTHRECLNSKSFLWRSGNTPVEGCGKQRATVEASF
jgi:hypothetical protein